MRYEEFKKVLAEATAIVERDEVCMVERVWEHFEANGINVNLDQVDKFIADVRR